MKTPTVYVPGPAYIPRILVYHEVSPQFQLGITAIPPARFLAHLQFLKGSGITIRPLAGLSEQSGQNSVCLTFDDAYQSFHDQVVPLLSVENIPAALFVITDFVGKRNDWDVTLGVNRRVHLDWSALGEIAASGIEIGSHTRTHKDLTRLSRVQAEDELNASRNILEDHLGRPIMSLALPFGSCNVEVFALARQAGYREICGGTPGWHGQFAGVLPRLPVYRGDGVRALQRKMRMSAPEVARLRLLQSFSRVTRLLKR